MITLSHLATSRFSLDKTMSIVAQAGGADGTTQDQKETVDVDTGQAVEKIDSWVDGAVRLLPNIVTAIVVLIGFWVLGVFLKKLIVHRLQKRDRANLGEVLGGFLKSAIIVSGFLMAATIVAPTLKFGDLIAGLGVSSVAIGFAFKDILQNWLAGLLILLRQPFEIGDQIAVDGHEGTVEKIETRATLIKTYDGQRIVIPNSNIYTSAVVVRTAHPVRRSQYDIGIGYADDIQKAKDAILDVIRKTDGVESDPAAEVITVGLDASWVTLRARWWTDSKRSDVVHVQARVIEAVKNRLDDEKIDMPYETQVHLFHDQTEESDGDRSQQREGWPADSDEGTKPRWKARDLRAED